MRDGRADEAAERRAGGGKDVHAVVDEDVHRALERAVRALQREPVAKDARKRGDAEDVQGQGHRRRAKDKVKGREEWVRALGNLELDEALKGEAGDDGRLRREVGVALDMKLELALAELERVALDAGEEDLLVGLEHGLYIRLGGGCGGWRVR